MRTEEINKWIEEGGDLPQELTQEEKEHLEGLGSKARRGWHDNGQLQYAYNYLHKKAHGVIRRWRSNGQLDYEIGYLHDMLHGVYRSWRSNGQLWRDEEWFYGNRIK